MHVTTNRDTPTFVPGSVTINYSTPAELALLKRVFGLNKSIPRALKADAKEPAKAFLRSVKSALATA